MICKFVAVWCVLTCFDCKMLVLLCFVVCRCVVYQMLLFVWCFRGSLCCFYMFVKHMRFLMTSMNICIVCKLSLKNIKTWMICVVFMIVSKENLKNACLLDFNQNMKICMCWVCLKNYVLVCGCLCFCVFTVL